MLPVAVNTASFLGGRVKCDISNVSRSPTAACDRTRGRWVRRGVRPLKSGQSNSDDEAGGVERDGRLGLFFVINITSGKK